MPEQLSPRLRVFVSSRMSELAEERAIVKEALRELHIDCWVFEDDAGAQSRSIEATFLKEVENADLYLGIFWRGHGPYTVEEYECAKRLEKDRLVYEKRTALEGRAPELQAFLDELSAVETGITPKWFDSADELAEYVKNDVAAWQTRVVQRKQRASDIIDVLRKRMAEQDRELAAKGLQLQRSDKITQDLAAAVANLTSQLGKRDAPSNLEKAVEELSAGRTEIARELFRKAAAEKEDLGHEAWRQAATAQRHLGALAYLDDTDAAVAAYRKATELDPEDPEGWDRLGHLLGRTGDKQGEERAYRKVLDLGKAQGDPEWEATGLRNVAIYLVGSKPDEAADMLERALDLHKESGHKEGMVMACWNLGVLYTRQGDTDKTLEKWEAAVSLCEEIEKAPVEFFEGLQSREFGMTWIATLSSRLGVLYEKRAQLSTGDLATADLRKAEAHHCKALERYREMGNENAADVEQMRVDLVRALLGT